MTYLEAAAQFYSEVAQTPQVKLALRPKFILAVAKIAYSLANARNELWLRYYGSLL